MPSDSRKRDKWLVWSQHWVGYKARVFGTYYTEAEARTAHKALKESPSAQWYFYSLEYRPVEAREEPTQ
jgi:hypothetical protein